MNRACSRRDTDEKYVPNYSKKNLKERGNFESQGVDKRIIIKWTRNRL
jgi:hypothetical protein